MGTKRWMPTCDIAIIIVCAGRHGTTERRAGASGMNTSMRILADTNILLGYVTDREPYDVFARRVVIACKEERAEKPRIACISPEDFLRKISFL